MKKLVSLTLIIFMFTTAIAITSPDTGIKLVGDFISINHSCKTSSTNGNNLEYVQKVIFKKDLVLSIVVKDGLNSRKLSEREIFKTIVTTSEKLTYYESGVDAKAMATGNKTYEFIFQNLEAAETFAQEILELLVDR